jgi:hypothetical protein
MHSKIVIHSSQSIRTGFEVTELLLDEGCEVGEGHTDIG